MLILTPFGNAHIPVLDAVIAVYLESLFVAHRIPAQIKSRNYPKVLEGYSGKMILVGINYDDKAKENSCKIEKVHI